jgi:hypothetical protein
MKMSKRHKHADVIIAWANGEEIEHYEDGGWYLWMSGVPPYFEDGMFRIKPKRVKKEGWVNVYPAYCGSVHRTENEANKSALGTRVACVRIEWEEEA